MGKRLKPKVGEIFGGYKVVSDEVFMIKDKNRDHCRGHYLVECLKCGRQRYSRSDILKSEKTTKCKMCHNKSNYKKLVEEKKIDHKGYSIGHQGTGGLSKTWVLTHVKYRALKRGIEFNESEMNTKFLWDLFLKQDRKCALTGVTLKLGSTLKGQSSTYNGNCHPDIKNIASLDRIDSNRGYTKDNVQWVLREINSMKSNYKQEDFINFCKLVVNYANQQPSIVNEHKSSNEGSETREMNSSVNNSPQESPTP